MSRSRRSFTLVELLVVLAILAALVAIVVPNLSGLQERAQRQRSAADMRALHSAVQAGAAQTPLVAPNRADSLLTTAGSLRPDLAPALAATLTVATLSAAETDALRAAGILELQYLEPASGSTQLLPVQVGASVAFRPGGPPIWTLPDGTPIDCPRTFLGLAPGCTLFNNVFAEVSLEAPPVSPLAPAGSYPYYLGSYVLGSDLDGDGTLSPGETRAAAGFHTIHDFQGATSAELLAPP